MSVTAPLTSVSRGTSTSPKTPWSINESSRWLGGMLWLETITVVSSPPCSRVFLHTLRVQDHGRRRRNGEHDGDRNYQTP